MVRGGTGDGGEFICGELYCSAQIKGRREKAEKRGRDRAFTQVCLCAMGPPPPPRGVNAHYAIAAVAITVLINRRKDLKLVPGLLQENGGKTTKVGDARRPDVHLHVSLRG